MIVTRRRHRLAPQPFAWFCNLASCMGEMLKIRLALRQGRAIAAVLTLRWRDRMVYKYGCSETAAHALGGMHLLMWRTIQDAKESGCRLLDLGRSDVDSAGLIAFKDRWGAERRLLEYFRSPVMPEAQPSALRKWRNGLVRNVLPHLPNRLLCAAGSAIYKHIG
jgi:hypothetical protein